MSPPTRHPTEDECRAKHRGLNWMVGTILVIVSGMAITVGYDASTSKGAADTATKVQVDLAMYHAMMDERDKSTADKLDALQSQINRRFEVAGKQLDKIEAKLDKAKP